MNSPGPEPRIRRATAADAAALAAVGAATFTETFAYLYAPEDLAAFLETSHSAATHARVLADPAIGAWLATLGDEPVGYAVAGPCKLPVEDLEPRAGEVRQLYVLARHQGLKLGSRMLELALAWLAGQGRTPVYVGVWSENHGAQRLYGRYGFEKVGEYGFPVGKQVDREFILKQRPAR